MPQGDMLYYYSFVPETWRVLTCNIPYGCSYIHSQDKEVE